jgi:ABC-type multidrug transport system fused ATPase/permease subunit
MNVHYFLKSLISFIGQKGFFWFLFGVLSSLILGLVELGVSFFLQIFLISLGFLNHDVRFLGFSVPKLGSSDIVIFLFFLGLIKFFAQLCTHHSASFLLDFLNCRLRTLVVHDLFLNYSNKLKNASEINFKISELFPRTSLFIAPFISFISSFLQCAVILICMFVSLWKESLFALVGLLVIGVLILKINKSVRAIASSVPLEQRKLNQGIEKISKNFLFISVMRTQKKELKSLLENVINYSSYTIRANFLNNFSISLSPLLGVFLLVSIIFTSQNVFKTSSFLLVSFLYLLIRFIQNLSFVVSFLGQINLNYPQFKMTLSYFLDYPLEKRTKALNYAQVLKFSGERKTFILPEKFLNQDKKSVSHTRKNDSKILNPPSFLFENVSYHYHASEKNIIKDLSFYLPGGKFMGIVGASGSGKSTLLMLLLNILEPQSGTIKINECSPQEFYKNFSYCIGYVGPEPFLINGTLRENVCYGLHRQVSEQEILEAIENANLKDLFLEKSLDFELAEDQQGLSAGQKQRVCLARAFLSNPKLLVLDEATANLDDSAEEEVTNSIQRLKGLCTVVIVSHRSGILRDVDKMICLKSL